MVDGNGDKNQKRIQNHYLAWSFLRKKVNATSRKLILQKALC